jgi:hypothetical protein
MAETRGEPILGATDDIAAIGQQLREAVEWLKVARQGSAALNAIITDSLAAILPAFRNAPPPGFCARPGTAWSSDLGATVMVLPPAYNFSLGQRDGICWAWLQPNDDWQPGKYEARHDHPGGSGLVVAYSPTLALMAAALLVYANMLEAVPEWERHRARAIAALADP